MVVEISKEYVSTFNRKLQTQLYNEIMNDYSFPRAVCRSLSELFIFYFDLYFGNQRKEGQIIFTAVSSNVPPGVPVNEMDLVPAIITTYDPDDCAVKDQKELLDKRIMRISNKALNQGKMERYRSRSKSQEKDSGTLSHFPQMSFQFSQFFLRSFFLKTALVAQTCVFEISHNFRHFAFIENFQHPFSEASVEIIIANFRIIFQKQ